MGPSDHSKIQYVAILLKCKLIDSYEKRVTKETATAFFKQFIFVGYGKPSYI
jgi:hypothetical protein